MLYEIMSSITIHNPHYLRKYLHFINTRTGLGNNLEKHHICPKAKDMFPEFANLKEFPWNQVLLTNREHIIAHKLLCKAYPASIGASLALSMMLRINSNTVLTYLKNTIVVTDGEKYFRVDKLDKRIKTGEVWHVSKNRVSALDTTTGIVKSVPIDTFNNKETLVGIAIGTTTVKNVEGSYSRVSIYDERYLSGELVGCTKGYVLARDSLKNIVQVKVDDSRFATGELIHINKGRVAVRDSTGKTFQTTIDDKRYLSGELVSASKGRKAPNNKIADSEVIAMRQSFAEKSIIFTDEFLKQVIKESDHVHIESKPLEELRLRNNTKASYLLLLSAYYSKQYNLPTTRIKEIILGHSYTHLK